MPSQNHVAGIHSKIAKGAGLNGVGLEHWKFSVIRRNWLVHRAALAYLCRPPSRYRSWFQFAYESD